MGYFSSLNPLPGYIQKTQELRFEIVCEEASNYDIISDMKKLILFLILILIIFLSTKGYPQTNRNGSGGMDRQIQEILKAREEMIKSLMNDSAFDNFDSHFEDMIRKFQQDSFGGMPGMDEAMAIGEYDWRETDTHQIFVLKVKQLKNKPLDIKIEKGLIKLKGDVESVSEDSSNKVKSTSKVHFERQFSIPEGLDQSNPQFENIDGELLIKFKKLTNSKSQSKPPIRALPKKQQDQRLPLGRESDDLTI